MEGIGAQISPLGHDKQEASKELSKIDAKIANLQDKIKKLQESPNSPKQKFKLIALRAHVHELEESKEKISNIVHQTIKTVKPKNIDTELLESLSLEINKYSKAKDVKSQEKSVKASISIMQKMSNKGCTDENGKTALHLACAANMPDLVKYLLQEGESFASIPVDLLMKENSNGISLFCQFMQDNELIDPVITKLSSVWEEEESQQFIKKEFDIFTRSLNASSLRSIEENLSHISQKSSANISIVKSFNESLMSAIQNKRINETLSNTALLIADDFNAGNFQEFMKFTYSDPPPDDNTIRKLFIDLKELLITIEKPLPSGWERFKNFIVMYERTINSINESFGINSYKIPSYKILQTTLYVIEKILSIDYKNMNSIIGANEELPFSLFIHDGNLTILPYDIITIAQELRDGNTTSLKQILYEQPPPHPDVIKCFALELTTLFDKQKEIFPLPLQSFNSIYNVILKSRERNDTTQALKDTIRIIEYNHVMNRPLDLSPDALLMTASIIGVSDALDRDKVLELRKILKSIQPENIENVLNELLQILSIQKKPLGDGWQFLSDIINDYNKASNNVTNYQKLEEILQIKFTDYVIRDGIDNNSTKKFVEYIHTSPPLSNEEIAHLMTSINQLKEESQNEAWEIITDTVQGYEEAVDGGLKANANTLSESFDVVLVMNVVNTITDNLEEDSGKDIFDKIRSSLICDPPLSDKLVNFITSQIREALEDEPSSEAVEYLNNVLHLHEKILKVRIEQGKGITASESLLIASSVEYGIKAVQNRRAVGDRVNTLFKKEVGKLPRDVHLDDSKNLTIWAKYDLSVVRGSGTYKKVFSAIKIPLDNIKAQAERVVVAHMKQPGMNKAVMDNEAYIADKLKGIKGIIQIHSVIHFEDSGEVNIGYILPEYGKDLAKLYSESKPDLKKQISIAKQLAYSVNEMHKRNVVHWDLKLENLLQDKEDVIIMDLGMAFEPGVRNPGYPSYGSPIFSAPEIIFNYQDFDWLDPEACKKAEIMSIGLMLYKLHFKEEFPYPYRAKSYDSFVESYKEVVEKPLDDLLQKKFRTPEDDYKILIYSMLRLNPDDRISMEKTLSELSLEP